MLLPSLRAHSRDQGKDLQPDQTRKPVKLCVPAPRWSPLCLAYSHLKHPGEASAVLRPGPSLNSMVTMLMTMLRSLSLTT